MGSTVLMHTHALSVLCVVCTHSFESLAAVDTHGGCTSSCHMAVADTGVRMETETEARIQPYRLTHNVTIIEAHTNCSHLQPDTL